MYRLGDWEIGRLGDWVIGRKGDGEIMGDGENGIDFYTSFLHFKIVPMVI